MGWSMSSVMELIERNRERLARLCASHKVKRLELFGSAASGQFDPRHSDLDFLADFVPMQSGQADACSGLLEGLEALFQRPIDLVMVSAIENPYFLASIAKTRTLLYAA